MEFFFTRTTPISSIGLLFGALLLAVSTNRGNGTLALVLMTSSSVLPLCPGDCLHLTCNSSSSPVVWTVYDTNNDMNYTSHAGASPSAGIATALPLQVGSFTFNITSQIVDNTESSSHSLISNITVDNVNVALNATVIICTEFATGIQDMVTVNVIDTHESKDLSPIVHISDPVFGLSNVTVDVTIQQDKHSNLSSHTFSLVMYNISVSSTIEAEVDLKESVDIEVTVIVPYNVHVQVNITIVPTLCGRSARDVPFTFPLIFYYANCGHPIFSNSTFAIEEMPVGTFPETEGRTYNFTCPPGLLLTGPNTTTCMENGEWEPDPRQAECIVNCGHPVFSSSTYTVKDMSVPSTEGSIFNFTCPPGLVLTGPNTTTCMENGEWEPDPTQAKCIADNRSQVVIIVTSSLAIGAVIIFVITVSTIIILKIKVIYCGIVKQKNRSEGVQLEHSTQENVTVDENASTGYRTLVYADLGPGLSCKQPRPFAPFDDCKMEYATINYKLTNEPSAVINNPDQIDEHRADKLLNLHTLLMQLQGEVTLQWYQFGKALGVEGKELDKATRLPSEQSIIEVLDHWIRNHNGPPTWKEIANALSQLNLHKLSLEIKHIYTEGKLVVENNEGHSIPKVTDLSKEKPPPIPAKYSMVTYTPDTDPQDYIQQTTLLNKPAIPPKLPPKTYAHEAAVGYEVKAAPARPPKPKRV